MASIVQLSPALMYHCPWPHCRYLSAPTATYLREHNSSVRWEGGLEPHSEDAGWNDLSLSRGLDARQQTGQLRRDFEGDNTFGCGLSTCRRGPQVTAAVVRASGFNHTTPSGEGIRACV